MGINPLASHYQGLSSLDFRLELKLIIEHRKNTILKIFFNRITFRIVIHGIYILMIRHILDVEHQGVCCSFFVNFKARSLVLLTLLNLNSLIFIN